MSSYIYSDGFKAFAKALEQRLANEPVLSEEELARQQRRQIKALVALERDFQDALLAHRSGPTIYEEFVEWICTEKGNILSARPYFRERQDVFTRSISSALKTRSAKRLYKYRVNWSFVAWVLQRRKWGPNSQIKTIANKIFEARKEILEQNLPLAISQARTFFSSTPRSHLTFMDIMQIQCQGLLLAIDKFCPPNERGMTDEESLDAFRSFRAVAIGIMRRDRVNDYSQTLIHYYPGDRQKIYWANKLLRRYVDEIDYSEISKEINTKLQEDGDSKTQTSPEEIADLLATASTVSADYAADPEGDTVVESAVGDDSFRPDVQAEQNSLYASLGSAIRQLSLVESKLLKLKGIHL